MKTKPKAKPRPKRAKAAPETPSELTLFAVAAMQALIGRDAQIKGLTDEQRNMSMKNQIAAGAWSMAKAMVDAKPQIAQWEKADL